MNDKQKARWEQVREEIACNFVEVIYRDGFITWERPEAERAMKQKGYQMADAILNLKDSAGYLVEVADPDQIFPEWVGFKRVIPREG